MGAEARGSGVFESRGQESGVLEKRRRGERRPGEAEPWRAEAINDVLRPGGAESWSAEARGSGGWG